MNESSSIYGGNGVSGRRNELGFAKHVGRHGTLTLFVLVFIHVATFNFATTVLTFAHLVALTPLALAVLRSSSDTLNHRSSPILFFHNAFLT
jgi:hypothetical protein